MSWATLCAQILRQGPTFLLIEDEAGHVFGSRVFLSFFLSRPVLTPALLSLSRGLCVSVVGSAAKLFRRRPIVPLWAQAVPGRIPPDPAQHQLSVSQFWQEDPAERPGTCVVTSLFGCANSRLSVCLGFRRSTGLFWAAHLGKHYAGLVQGTAHLHDLCVASFLGQRRLYAQAHRSVGRPHSAQRRRASHRVVRPGPLPRGPNDPRVGRTGTAFEKHSGRPPARGA